MVGHNLLRMERGSVDNPLNNIYVKRLFNRKLRCMCTKLKLVCENWYIICFRIPRTRCTSLTLSPLQGLAHTAGGNLNLARVPPGKTYKLLQPTGLQTSCYYQMALSGLLQGCSNRSDTVMISQECYKMGDTRL